MPLDLTDDQIIMIENFARPLHQLDRGPYLQTVARLLAGHEIGDGVINRVCRQAQREFLRAPAGAELRERVGKYAR